MEKEAYLEENLLLCEFAFKFLSSCGIIKILIDIVENEKKNKNKMAEWFYYDRIDHGYDDYCDHDNGHADLIV